MPSTIVCGVDGSDGARAVQDTAEWLAGGLGARLQVLHVTDGDPADRLLDAVDEEGAELLVVGSRGRGSVSSAVLGSVSRRLTTDARCPVVVVPPDVSAPSQGDPDQSSIVCGVDGSDHSTAAVRLGAELARRMGFRLVVVHAVAGLSGYVAYPGQRTTAPPPSAQPDAARRLAEEIVDAAVRAAGEDATGIVESGTPWDVLQGVADRENGLLVVIAARGLSPLRAALLGSVATTLATTGTHLLAILPEPAEDAWAPPNAG
jgi:nucleotide-binding universal stress UspA family protein